MQRREFLQNAAAAAALATCFPASLAAIERDTAGGKLEQRTLGRTGARLSLIAFPGILLNRSTPEKAARWVRDAFEAGVTHFDVAPEYGTAEERMGPALEPYRSRVFLSCKTAKRTRADAAAELDRSLQRLRTDHVDLYQCHHVTRLAEVDTICGRDGALEAMLQAKKDGKVRFLGFSAHSVEAALALMNRHDFDTIMFPVNYATWHAGDFGPQVLAKAQEKRMGVIAIKALCKQAWPRGADRSAFPNCWYEPMSDPADALLALRFTLSHPVTTAVLPGAEKSLYLGLNLAPKFTPLTADEAELIKRKSTGVPLIFRNTGVS